MQGALLAQAAMDEILDVASLRRLAVSDTTSDLLVVLTLLEAINRCPLPVTPAPSSLASPSTAYNPNPRLEAAGLLAAVPLASMQLLLDCRRPFGGGERHGVWLVYGLVGFRFRV